MHIRHLFPLISKALDRHKGDSKTRKRLRSYYDLIREILEDREASHKVEDLSYYLHPDDVSGILDACGLRPRSPSSEEQDMIDVPQTPNPTIEEEFEILRAYSRGIQERIVELHALRTHQRPSREEWQTLQKDLDDMKEMMESLKLWDVGGGLANPTPQSPHLGASP